MQFIDLSPKVQSCLLFGALAAISDNLEGTKYSKSVDEILENLAITGDSFDTLADSLSEEENNELHQYANYLGNKRNGVEEPSDGNV